MKHEYSHLSWSGLYATGTVTATDDSDPGMPVSKTFSAHVNYMLTELANDVFPSEFAEARARRHRRLGQGAVPRPLLGRPRPTSDDVTIAKRLLSLIPVPFVAGFIVDCGEFYDTWDPKTMHRECYARLNDKRVGRGEQRFRWVEPITMWTVDLECSECHIETAPSQDVFDATPELISQALPLADLWARTLLTTELMNSSEFPEWLDLTSIDADEEGVADSVQQSVDYLFLRHLIFFHPDNPTLIQLVPESE